MTAADISLLQQSPYFRDLRPEDLALVQSHTRLRDLTAGEIILLEGLPAEALFMVCRGRVRVFRSSAEGRELTLFVLGPGTTFNDVAAFDGGTNLASAQAIDAGTGILMVPASLLAHLTATNPRMARSVVHVLASRVRQLAALAEDVSLRDTSERVVRFLAEESAATGRVVISRQEIAERIGSVREVVSRVLHRLEEAGAVRRLGSHVLEVDTQMLHTLVAAEPATGARHIAAHVHGCAELSGTRADDRDPVVRSSRS